MTDPDRHIEGGLGGDGRHRQFNWDAVTAVAALIIGVIAILISAYTAWSTRQQTRAQAWPHVIVGTSGILPAYMVRNGTTPKGGGGLFAVNHGVGPAIVRRVEVLVNGKPEPNWSRVFKALGYAHRPNAGTSAFDGRVFSPGQRVYLVAIGGRKNWLRFKHKAFQEMIVRTCYCSVLGDCWINTMQHSVPLNQRTRSVSSCTQIPEHDQFNG